MRLRADYVIMLVLFGLTGVPSCWGWEESQEETKKAISTMEEETSQEDKRAEDFEELKDVMASASRQMKRLDVALNGNPPQAEGEKAVNWTTTRDSAKSLEDLIGRRCVNSYIKVHRDVPQEFVQISQRFNDAVLRLLIAEHYRDATLAKGQFQLLQERCEECHQKYRKEAQANTQ